MKKKDFHLISWPGDIFEGKALEIIKSINDLNQDGKTPRLLICSCGGDPSVALGFYEYVKTHKLEFETFIVGYANSSAVIVSLSAPLRLRFCTKSATVFLHRMGMRYEKTRLNDKELEIQMKQIRSMNKKYINIISKETKLKKEEVDDFMTAKTEFNALKIKKFGFANPI